MPEPPETVQNAEEQKTTVDLGGEVAASPSKTIPAGIKPLFFSGPSQQIFGCVVDVDVTPSNPHTFIPKEKIAEDFKNRAAVSDFHPVKKILLVIFHLMHTKPEPHPDSFCCCSAVSIVDYICTCNFVPSSELPW